MNFRLKKCPSCKEYTLHEECKNCKTKTKEAHYKFLKTKGLDNSWVE